MDITRKIIYLFNLGNDRDFSWTSLSHRLSSSPPHSHLPSRVLTVGVWCPGTFGAPPDLKRHSRCPKIRSSPVLTTPKVFLVRETAHSPVYPLPHPPPLLVSTGLSPSTRFPLPPAFPALLPHRVHKRSSIPTLLRVRLPVLSSTGTHTG